MTRLTRADKELARQIHVACVGLMEAADGSCVIDSKVLEEGNSAMKALRGESGALLLSKFLVKHKHTPGGKCRHECYTMELY